MSRPGAASLLLGVVLALLRSPSLAVAGGCAGGGKRPSQLWGCAGERWDRTKLPVDWSYAGYAAGEKGLPTKPVSVDVRQMGAKGDGKADDTWAIEKAIGAAREGSAVYFPPGRYVISRRLDIRRSVVLRGAGKASTTLFFPRSLADAYGNRGGWGHGTCFVNFRGSNPVNHATRIGGIKNDVPKGGTQLYLDSTRGVAAGQWVRVVLEDSSGAFKASLLGNSMEPGWPGSAARNLVRFSSRVKSVDPGKGLVVLERPLPWEAKQAFSPSLHAVRPTLSEAGVEGLTFEMAWTPYPGHLKEDGWNALHFNQLSNSWVRDVRFLNTDAAFYAWGCSFITVTGVEVDVTKSRTTGGADYWNGKDRNGHRGIWTEFGSDNLFTNIAMRVPFYHDFSVATGETCSVFASSWGTDLNLDFHKGLPNTNLYTDLQLGAGSRVFRSGGGVSGPHAAGYNTFFNLKSAQAVALPPAAEFGPLALMNFEGVLGRDAASARQDTRPLVPSNLWLAMRSRRLGW